MGDGYKVVAKIFPGIFVSKSQESKSVFHLQTDKSKIKIFVLKSDKMKFNMGC